MIKETNPKHGVHYRPILEEEKGERDKLPLIIERHIYTAEACRNCIDWNDDTVFEEIHHEL